MQSEDLTFNTGFRVSVGNAQSQGAVMVLARGGCEGGPDNRHRGADQWLIVIAGRGLAVVEGRAIKLRVGSMVLIERGERHEIRNTGRGLLKTVSVYLPPAYEASGSERPAGRR